ncbi:MAG: DnaJ domain-containing protein [Spirosomataceae bacterium]
MFKDYYKLLEIPQNANDGEIKKAFRVQAIKWHPDRNLGTDTTVRMQEINEAYLILKDKEARERFDIEYNKFRQYLQTKSQAESNQTKSEKEEQNNKYHDQNNSRSQYEYSDYKVEDDLLAKWMANAKNQAVELAKQTIKDFKGVTKAAANGCMNGVIHLVIWGVVANLIFFLFKACNH